MYESDDEQSKGEFYYHESNNQKNNIENDDSMLRYTYVSYVVKNSYIIKSLLTLTARLLRENIRTRYFNDCSLG